MGGTLVARLAFTRTDRAFALQCAGGDHELDARAAAPPPKQPFDLHLAHVDAPAGYLNAEPDVAVFLGVAPMGINRIIRPQTNLPPIEKKLNRTRAVQPTRVPCPH